MHEPLLESSSSQDSVEEAADARRSPNTSFAHSAQPHVPTLVIEMSYSQQRKDLAEGYVVGSKHMTRYLGRLDIAYQPSTGKAKHKKAERQATLSVWRPGSETTYDDETVGVCRTDIDNDPFRDGEGQALSHSARVAPTILSISGLLCISACELCMVCISVSHSFGCTSVSRSVGLLATKELRTRYCGLGVAYIYIYIAL